jgi:hypothetical protein
MKTQLMILSWLNFNAYSGLHNARIYYIYIYNIYLFIYYLNFLYTYTLKLHYENEGQSWTSTH